MENIYKIWYCCIVCILTINYTDVERWYFCDFKKHFIKNKLRKVEVNMGNNEFDKGKKQNDFIFVKIDEHFIKWYRNIIVAVGILKKTNKKYKPKQCKI